LKVAVISDIHGNMHALEAALDDISRQDVDRIVCAGDVPNPFLRSREAWLKLKELGIPVIRGNHEDYIVSYYSGDRPEVHDSVQFQPIQIVARHLGPEIAREFAALPFDMLIPGPSGDDLYLCHASPQHNARSYLLGVDSAMQASFAERVPASARTVVAGHIHTQWSGSFRDKNLVICGSVGLPHHGKPEAEYAILTHRGGAWRWDLRTVPYDLDAALAEYRDSGAFAQGGPIAWMIYDELLCGEPRLVHFLPALFAQTPAHSLSIEGWSAAAEAYLKKIGRWQTVSDTFFSSARHGTL
jgi:predicted phosphodiesterase